jgi:hypothetical protein
LRLKFQIRSKETAMLTITSRPAIFRLLVLIGAFMSVLLLTGCSGTLLTIGEPREVRIGEDGSFAMLSEVKYCRDNDGTIFRQRWITCSPADTRKKIAASVGIKDAQGRLGFAAGYPDGDNARGEVLDFDATLPDSTDAVLPEALRKQAPAASATTVYGQKAYVIKVDGVEYAMTTGANPHRYYTPAERARESGGLTSKVFIVVTTPIWVVALIWTVWTM